VFAFGSPGIGRKFGLPEIIHFSPICKSSFASENNRNLKFMKFKDRRLPEYYTSDCFLLYGEIYIG
jgi:hypothetical protein